MSKLKCQYSNRTFAYTYSKEHTGLHRNDNDLYLNSFMYHPYHSMTGSLRKVLYDIGLVVSI